MRLPWRREKRESAPFTDAVTAALVAQAKGGAVNAAATAALESCAALYAAAFAMAEVRNGGMAAGAIMPATLSLTARNLIRRGEDVHLIEVDGGGLSLVPAGGWDLRGNHDRRTWTYRVDCFGPSGNVTRVVPAAGIVHTRYAVDPSRPWQGIGPLSWARHTAALAGRLESGLADEAGAPSAQLLPIPADGGDGGESDPLARLKTDIGNAKGAPLLVETTSAGWGDSQGGAPRRDWQQQRIGPDWPEVLRNTRRDVIDSVAGACNVPAVLLDRASEGTSQREGLRRFLHFGIEPMGAMIAAEFAAKLGEPALWFDFGRLMASDIAGKARSVKALTGAGMSLESALGKVGL